MLILIFQLVLGCSFELKKLLSREKKEDGELFELLCNGVR